MGQLAPKKLETPMMTVSFCPAETLVQRGVRKEYQLQLRWWPPEPLDCLHNCQIGRLL